MLYKRGEVWWYKFPFNGQFIRESAHTNSKTMARDAERARRRELELAVNRIPKRRRMPFFSLAAAEWLQGKSMFALKSVTRYKGCTENLKGEFGGRLVCDIDSQDIAAYQRKRLAGEVSNRTVNYEVGTLRGILKTFGLWGQISDQVDALKENHDVGRALSRDEEEALIKAAGKSRSPALLPLLVFFLDTGMRASEVRSLRRRDLVLVWKEGVITSGEARLAENPAVSEGTIKALAGHVSKKMLERYSHIRTHAKRAAIESLEQNQVPVAVTVPTTLSEAEEAAISGEGGHKIGHTQ